PNFSSVFGLGSGEGCQVYVWRVGKLCEPIRDPLRSIMGRKRAERLIYLKNFVALDRDRISLVRMTGRRCGFLALEKWTTCHRCREGEQDHQEKIQHRQFRLTEHG